MDVLPLHPFDIVHAHIGCRPAAFVQSVCAVCLESEFKVIHHESFQKQKESLRRNNHAHRYFGFLHLDCVPRVSVDLSNLDCDVAVKRVQN